MGARADSGKRRARKEREGKVSRGVGGGGGPDQQQQQEEICVACVCACDSGHDDDDRVKEQEEKVRWPNPVFRRNWDPCSGFSVWEEPAVPGNRESNSRESERLE